MAEIRDVFLKALPGISVAMRGCWGPFEDTEGVSSHFDGAAGRLAGVKKIKRIWVDLLTSCAKVLREATGFKPQFMVGLGQGGLVVAAPRWPLVVELTLQARNLQKGSPFRWRGLGRTQGGVVNPPQAVEDPVRALGGSRSMPRAGSRLSRTAGPRIRHRGKDRRG